MSNVTTEKIFKNRIEEREWLTTEEAAEYLRLSPRSLLNRTSNGFIPYSKLGRSNRYHLDDLRKVLLRTKKGGLDDH